MQNRLIQAALIIDTIKMVQIRFISSLIVNKQRAKIILSKQLANMTLIIRGLIKSKKIVCWIKVEHAAQIT